MSLRFDGRVAIVTGAGQGLGRSHALGLAKRGAKVVVNDLGSARDGTGRSSEAARAVVEEIRASGGEAVANGADVTRYADVEDMVRQTLDTWGRVDILVNNAGILRDKTFHKVALDDFFAVIDVHLKGSVHCTHAVWETFRSQGYGRVVFTTSSSGLYGNFGQASYGCAKLGLVGLMNTLALEGQKYDIRVNCLSPVAATRMTRDLIGEQAQELLTPESVTAGLLHLVDQDAPNRVILAAGAGTFARAAVTESAGFNLRPDDCTPENVAAHWDRITDSSESREYQAGREQTASFLAKAGDNLGIRVTRE